MPDFSKASRGQALRIPAATYNALMAVGERFQTATFSADGPTIAGYGHNVVRVRNTTASTVPRFGVLGINGIDATPSGDTFPEAIVLQGGTPLTTYHANRFLVTLEPIAAGRLGLAAAAGVFPCRVNVTNTTHQFATVKNNDTTQLTSSGCGVLQLLWIDNPTSTGANKWAVGVL